MSNSDVWLFQRRWFQYVNYRHYCELDIDENDYLIPSERKVELKK